MRINLHGVDNHKLNLRILEKLQARHINPDYEYARRILNGYSMIDVRLNPFIKTRFYNIVKNIKFGKVIKSLSSQCANMIFSRQSQMFVNGMDSTKVKNSKIQVCQFVPILAPRDAIGNEVLAIRHELRKLGYESAVFVKTLHPEMIHEAKRFTKCKMSGNDVIIYHHATGSDLVNFIIRMPSRKILIYHNITPHKFFVGINNETAESSKLGREQLYLLRDKVDLAIADSEINRMELEKIGFVNTLVMPILIDFQRYNTKLKEDLVRKYNDSANFLFVGRIAPNKKIEDVIKIFAYYNRCINSNSNLFIVGGNIGTERYHAWLKDLIRKARISNVHFITAANRQELVTYYRIADLFVCMSEHEGFCVPLLESMYFKVPIVAYDSTAVPYTLGDAGILVSEKNFEEIGELIDIILEDQNMKDAIIEKQSRRLDDFSQETDGDFLVKCVQKVLQD